MKNLFLIFLIFLVGCATKKEKKIHAMNGVNTEETEVLMPYKPLKEFNGDTLAFVQQSILDRKEYYVGKELNVLLKDLQIPIKYYSFYPAPVNIYKVYDTYLTIRNYKEEDDYVSKGKDPISLAIRWTPPLDANALDFVPKKEKGVWSKKVQDYLGKQIVGDIVKTDYKLNK